MSDQTMIKHHLSDPMLMAYAAGNLPEAFGLVVVTHMSVCAECQARAESFDAVGGALLAKDDGIEMQGDALAATMKLIDTPEAKQIRMEAPQSALFPEPLRAYVGGDVETVKWRAAGGGVRQAILPTSNSATVRLLYIPEGKALPDHGHRGTEMTMVLQGAFCDEFDRFGPGDVEVADADLTHTPVAEMGEDCICLAATDAPLKFRRLLPRLVQPFLKI